ncbi:hypothetical protein BKA70DRAFT_1307603 [Coprinopsis sp. MPI-PUGE-AT-0042]|nr:hypothetical protein BKA70DRAFT_1307603 [Coprinopsis sp. MPI-PUGE-AT-0042]
MLFPTHVSKLAYTLLILLTYLILSATSLPLPRSSRSKKIHRLNVHGAARPPMLFGLRPPSFNPWNTVPERYRWNRDFDDDWRQ